MPDLTPMFARAMYDAQQSRLQPQLSAIRQQEIAADTAAQQQEIDEVSSANSRSNATLNSGALASARRRAGGGTFRRRGSATSANQLVSGLGQTNARQLATQRRAVIADSSRRQQEEAQRSVMSDMSLRPKMRVGGGQAITVYN